MLDGGATMADLVRRLANLIRPGRIEAVDYPAARVRVRVGEMLTGWRPWLTWRAGADVTWWAPELGEQVLLLSPDGEPAQSWVLPAGFSDAAPAPADRATIHVVRYADGATISYDRLAHVLRAEIPGDAVLTATGNVAVTADGTVTVTAKGAVTITSDTSIRLAAPTITLAGAQSISLQTPALSMARGGGGGKTAGTLDADLHLTGDLAQQGNQAVTGAVAVTGSITATGDIKADGASDNHHSHP